MQNARVSQRKPPRIFCAVQCLNVLGRPQFEGKDSRGGSLNLFTHCGSE